jgi:hypothetical protein
MTPSCTFITLDASVLYEIPKVDFSWNEIAFAGQTFSQGREQSAGQSSGSNSVLRRNY